MFIAVAIVAGVAIGLLRGGRFENFGEASFRLWPLLVLGVVVQSAAAFTSAGAVTLILASYGLLLLFTGANLHHAGMGVVGVGIAMNVLVIGVNGGMPVRDDAIVAAGIVERGRIPSLDFGAKRHLETDDDRLTFLGDIIPVPVAEEVLSFGDLAMSVGVAAVLANLFRRRVNRPVLGGSGSPDSG
ncbi:MAG TPA: DUF5317 family protein [Acidimicrobiales bacterium]|nr:DUF5317 family protein [Acidimicrobiales bacterium]